MQKNLVVVVGLQDIMFDVENELPYLGSDKGNMDILVHFMEKIGEEPCMIHNQDRNKFGIFCAHGDVYHFADELKLSLCNLYTLWFKSAVNGNILPLKYNVDVSRESKLEVNLFVC